MPPQIYYSKNTFSTLNSILIHVEQAKIGIKRKQMEKSHIIDDRDHVHVVMDG
jgi:hypothetical protein